MMLRPSALLLVLLASAPACTFVTKGSGSGSAQDSGAPGDAAPAQGADGGPSLPDAAPGPDAGDGGASLDASAPPDAAPYTPTGPSGFVYMTKETNSSEVTSYAIVADFTSGPNLMHLSTCEPTVVGPCTRFCQFLGPAQTNLAGGTLEITSGGPVSSGGHVVADLEPDSANHYVQIDTSNIWTFGNTIGIRLSGGAFPAFYTSLMPVAEITIASPAVGSSWSRSQDLTLQWSSGGGIGDLVAELRAGDLEYFCRWPNAATSSGSTSIPSAVLSQFPAGTVYLGISASQVATDVPNVRVEAQTFASVTSGSITSSYEAESITLE